MDTFLIPQIGDRVKILRTPGTGTTESQKNNNAKCEYSFHNDKIGTVIGRRFFGGWWVRVPVSFYKPEQGMQVVSFPQLAFQVIERDGEPIQ